MMLDAINNTHTPLDLERVLIGIVYCLLVRQSSFTQIEGGQLRGNETQCK